VTLREAIALLTGAQVPSAEHDARALAAYAESTGTDFAALVRRRADRVPLQHLIGSVGFRYIDIEVGPGVFVPRPETEVVAGIAIDRAREQGDAPLVVDLCSGSGVIALSVANEVPSARVHAVELDPDALSWLSRNATRRREAGDASIAVHEADVADALPELDGAVDVVVSNPPYVSTEEIALVDPEVRDHDPRLALVAGEDGLGIIRHVAEAARRLLRPGGWVVVEHSDRQGESAPAVLDAAGFVDVTDTDDLTGRPRVATGRQPT
jgi:release factor glutamine methyltransferase